MQQRARDAHGLALAAGKALAAFARQALGWQPRHTFEDGLAETVRWYRNNEPWWRAVKDGSYRDFYRAWYEERTA